ncbi:ABC transporter permease [Mangrovivirga sp. M17]|uniref:ABC transporter permease n=1 Tax=Mangrovivirga halotolerans TaxID=2993936 RepID=A0ABT3RNN4_9BACT|nr:ABC transporter permease [Mangrovivirga halotolerans]MCX2743414.1 ABC transporter permease [Mangrovivirga halotolerans]
MLKFIGRRLGYGLLVMMGVTVIVFFLFHLLPGDPARMVAGKRSDITTIEAINKEFGLDKPLPVQFYLYLKDLSPISIHEDTPQNQDKYEYTELINLGEEVLVLKAPYLRRSFQTNKRVGELLMENLEPTIWLALAAMAFATIFGIAIGVVSAVNQHKFLDNFLVAGSVLGISLPSFVAAIIISMIFGYYLADWTGLGLTGQLYDYSPFGGKTLNLKNLVLPAFTLGIRPLAIIMQLTRSSMLDVLKQDYIRTAYSKGLPYKKVLVKHALKNALNPVITAVSGWLASLMAGAFFVELVFDWKGFGYVTIKAVESLDFPVVMGAVLIIALIFVFVNILVDALYALIDPRVRIS